MYPIWPTPPSGSSVPVIVAMFVECTADAIAISSAVILSDSALTAVALAAVVDEVVDVESVMPLGSGDHGLQVDELHDLCHHSSVLRQKANCRHICVL